MVEGHPWIWPASWVFSACQLMVHWLPSLGSQPVTLPTLPLGKWTLFHPLFLEPLCHFPTYSESFFFFFQGPIQPGYFNFHTISWNSCKYNFSILLHLLEKYFNFLWWFQYRLFLQVMDEERTINCAQLWSLAIPIQHFFHLSWCVVLASETLPEKSVSMAQPGFGIHVVPSTQSFLARMGHSWSVAVVR